MFAIPVKYAFVYLLQNLIKNLTFILSGFYKKPRGADTQHNTSMVLKQLEQDITRFPICSI